MLREVEPTPSEWASLIDQMTQLKEVATLDGEGRVTLPAAAMERLYLQIRQRVQPGHWPAAGQPQGAGQAQVPPQGVRPPAPPASSGEQIDLTGDPETMEAGDGESVSLADEELASILEGIMALPSPDRELVRRRLSVKTTPITKQPPPKRPRKASAAARARR
eukprot:5108533-Lingulodinium_polyedra.AAC.1